MSERKLSIAAVANRIHANVYISPDSKYQQSPAKSTTSTRTLARHESFSSRRNFRRNKTHWPLVCGWASERKRERERESTQYRFALHSQPKNGRLTSEDSQILLGELARKRTYFSSFARARAWQATAREKLIDVARKRRVRAHTVKMWI